MRLLIAEDEKELNRVLVKTPGRGTLYSGRLL